VERVTGGAGADVERVERVTGGAGADVERVERVTGGAGDNLYICMRACRRVTGNG